MKKIFLIIVFIFSTLNIAAQWKGTYYTDSYTEEKEPMIEYINKANHWKLYYLDHSLYFVFLHPQTDNFDLWWNAQMDNNGWIEYTSDVDFNFIGKDAKELNYNGKIKNYDNDGLYFRFIVDDENGKIISLLKNNKKLNIRLYNIVKERIMVYNIPLNGVSLQCKRVGL